MSKTKKSKSKQIAKNENFQVELCTFFKALVKTQTQANPSKLRQTQANSGKLKQTQANSSKLKQTQANSSKLKQTQANPGKPRQIQANPGLFMISTRKIWCFQLYFGTYIIRLAKLKNSKPKQTQANPGYYEQDVVFANRFLQL